MKVKVINSIAANSTMKMFLIKSQPSKQYATTSHTQQRVNSTNAMIRMFLEYNEDIGPYCSLIERSLATCEADAHSNFLLFNFTFFTYPNSTISSCKISLILSLHIPLFSKNSVTFIVSKG